jgi:hypothetical protein
MIKVVGKTETQCLIQVWKKIWIENWRESNTVQIYKNGDRKQVWKLYRNYTVVANIQNLWKDTST